MASAYDSDRDKYQYSELCSESSNSMLDLSRIKSVLMCSTIDTENMSHNPEFVALRLKFCNRRRIQRFLWEKRQLGGYSQMTGSSRALIRNLSELQYLSLCLRLLHLSFLKFWHRKHRKQWIIFLSSR